jgi:pimeloyl-ACP methyl ester carboxylesterase
MADQQIRGSKLERGEELVKVADHVRGGPRGQRACRRRSPAVVAQRPGSLRHLWGNGVPFFQRGPESVLKDDRDRTTPGDDRLYWENRFAFFGPKNVTIPVAVSVFPEELYQPPRSWAERAYPKLVHYNKLDRGGHFPAWEQPQLFVEEVRAGCRSLRT